jgi:shikimate kinase
MNKGIVFCGFMGAGKSRIGWLTAGRLGFRFEDLDESITKSEKSSITEIFNKHGEKYFRELELKHLYEKINDTDRILSLGGGTLQTQQVVDDIKNENLLVFIAPPFNEILQRVKGNDKRPLVMNPDGSPKSFKELSSELADLYTKRLEYYEQADITLKTEPLWDSFQSTNNLIQLLGEYGYQI